MTATTTLSVNPLRILVADDDTEFRKLVVETLGNTEALRIVQCSSLATLQRLRKEQRKFDVCILDVRFHRQVNQYSQIARFVRSESPDALIVVLSNYVQELSEAEKKFTDASLPKPRFRGSPELLLKQLVSLVEASESINQDTKDRAIAHFQRQQDLLTAGIIRPNPAKVKELLEITGSVQQVYGPFVDVMVLDVKVGGKSLAEENRPRNLYMPKTMFAAKELLGTFTQFRYRYWEEENGRRSEEVFPREDPEGTPMPDDPSLEKLLDIQKLQQRTHRKHA